MTTFRSLVTAVVGLALTLLAAPSSAQSDLASFQPALLSADFRSALLNADQDPQKPADPKDAQKPDAPDTQKPDDPPATVAAKETRGFFSTLALNVRDDVKHLPRWNTAFVLALGGSLALAAHQADDKINAKLVGTADAAWGAGQFIGSSRTVLSAAAATYVVGRVRKLPRVQHLGMDEIEAVLLAEVMVNGIKQIVRRKRPPQPEGDQPISGFSFPSGHATVTFAAATVLQQHLGYKAGIPTYLVAAYVAMSRMHDNRHFASDVIFGSAMGVVIGRTVTWHGRHFYGSPMLLPDGGGILIAMKLGPDL